MKKAIIAMALMGVMGFAGHVSAEGNATQVFSWAGTVPAMATSNGLVIADANGNPLTEETLQFAIDSAGKVSLKSSGAISFKVFEKAQGSKAIGAPVNSYKYTLTSLRTGNGTLATEQDDDGLFSINALNNGKRKTLKRGESNTASEPTTVLSVVMNNGSKFKLSANDNVAVQAELLVENQA